MPLDFFDCNMMLGTRSALKAGAIYKTCDIVKIMERCNIKEAAVYHCSALEYHPACGNTRLMDEIRPYSFFYPVWVLLPGATGDFEKGAKLLESLKSNNVRLARIFPGAQKHNFSIAKWNCGELFDMLDGGRIPLIVDINDFTWDQLVEIAHSYRNMPLILSRVGYRNDRNIYKILEKYENVYLETSFYKVFLGIEKITEVFGAGRLIFGSDMPVHSGGSAVTLVTHAQISMKEKEMIAGGNLKKLMKNVRY
jgi:hypothetical protein